MANKSQRRIRMSLRRANGELALEVPASGYHNNVKGAWQPRRIQPGFQKRLSKFAKVARKATKEDFNPKLVAETNEVQP